VDDRRVITLLGADRPGLVETVSKAVADHGGNWEESRMARLAGHFAGVLLVSVAPGAAEALESQLRALGGMQVVVDRGKDSRAEGSRLMEIELVGNDRPGIISEVSAVLAARGVNIEELESSSESAPMAGHNLFRMVARVSAAGALDTAALRAELEALAGDLMVDISLDESVGS